MYTASPVNLGVADIRIASTAHRISFSPISKVFLCALFFFFVSVFECSAQSMTFSGSFPLTSTTGVFNIRSIISGDAAGPQNRTVTYTFTGTSGAAVGTSVVLGLEGNSSDVTMTLKSQDLAASTGNSGVVTVAYTSVAPPPKLPSGSYSLRACYKRVTGGATVCSSLVTVTLSPPPLDVLVTSPSASTVYKAPLPITFEPQRPYQSGTLKLIFQSGSTVVNTLTLADSLTSSNSISLNPSSILASSASILSTTSPTLADGTYTVSMEYRPSSPTGYTATTLSTAVANVTLDTTAPSLSQVSAPPALGNSGNPSVTISSTEAGTVTYGGACRSSVSAVSSGNTTIALASDTGGAALGEGTFSGCTITVTDAAGNVSAALPISTFTIDRTPPTLSLITPVASIGSAPTPAVTFSSTEAGTLGYAGRCSGVTTAVSAGNNTISLSAGGLGHGLPEGTYSNCTLQVQDPAGNTSSILSIPTFTVDSTAPPAPVLGGISNPSRNRTPTISYTLAEGGDTVRFTSNINGTVGTQTSQSGMNSVTLSALNDGVHAIEMSIADSALNTRTTGFSLTIDTTAPVISLVGSESVTVLQGGEYTEAGATALDAIAGDLTSSITTVNPVNPAVPGIYAVTYTVSDPAGNRATRTRAVTVVASAQTPTPTSTPMPIVTPLPTNTPTSGSGTSQISVVVRDRDGNPVANASVGIGGLALAVTNADGEATVTVANELLEGSSDFLVSVQKDGYQFPSGAVQRGGMAEVVATAQSALPQSCTATDLERVELLSDLSALFSNTLQISGLAERRAKAIGQSGKVARFRRNQLSARLDFSEVQALLMKIPSRTISCGEKDVCRTLPFGTKIKGVRGRSRHLFALVSPAAAYVKGHSSSRLIESSRRLARRALQAKRRSGVALKKIPKRILVCE